MKYLDIKGCCVIDESGEGMGVVGDCIFDSSSKRIYSCIVIKKTPLAHSYILKFNNIKHFGDNLMVKGKLFPVNKNVIVKNSNKMFNSYIDRAVIDSNGNAIGEMKDAIIEEDTGIVKAIICSRGFVEDMMEGRGVILVDQETIFGQDKIIIKDSTINIYNDMSIWKLTRG
jgi:uncharacterized protein YrrD